MPNTSGQDGVSVLEGLNSEQVADLHLKDDLDVRPESHHHSLGAAPTQAAPGSHRHRGGDSELLLSGTTLTGSRGGNVALISVINALVILGAQDSTSA